MADDKLASSLQHAVLTALCFDVEHGTQIAVQVKAEYFDSVYRDFVTKVLVYRRRYGRPPGINYIDDLAEQSSFGKDNKLVTKNLVPTLIAESESLNGVYVESRVQDFVRRQVLKGAIIEASDRYVQDNDSMVQDVEKIFHNAISFRQQTFDAGIFLNDPKGLKFVTDNQENVLPLGIKDLDNLQIGPIPKELLVYIAPKGSGKTWFCIHCGRQALIHRWKVAHISLEFEQTKVLRRYYQNLFSVASRPDKFLLPTLERNDFGRLTGFDTERTKPKLDLTNPKIRKILLSKLKPWGARFGNLVIKDFPTGQLTISQLVSYLDYLESVEGFIPNLLIIDYPKLMSLGQSREPRFAIGKNFEDLRGIAMERNMAVVAPHQGTRSTIGARKVRSKDAGEDISVVQTADTVLTYSRTSAEESRGLGRLSVEHTRDTRSGLTVLLAQSYDLGQYVLDSELMQSAYWEKLKEFSAGEDNELED